jgi:excinuclease ABC subunit C
LPDSPGVYQFLNDDGKIIYVGKAKSLKKRVVTYFSKTQENEKIAMMVSKIVDMRFIVVDSESDALLLENNMIKKYLPRYNIMLKDDKTFPWIVVRNECFPRVYLTRNPVGDGSQYFGPYTSVKMIRSLLNLIKHLYQLRSCNLNLTGETIAKHKFKVCLEYHIGNCKAPCVEMQSEKEYEESIIQICNILKGNITTVIRYLKTLMNEYSDSFRFEEAEVTKNKIIALEKYRAKSAIVNPSINNVDVFSYEENINCAYVNCLHIVDGAVVQAHTVEIIKRLDEQSNELLGYAITDMRERFASKSPEIVVPFFPDVLVPCVTYTIPKTGDKKELLNLSYRNAKFFKLEKERQIEKTDPDRHVNRVMETLKRDLHLSELPVHIECFDNSNTQGTNPVAACVVFKNAHPSKKDYRHYNIKTVEGPDDYASMEEVVFRRYRRLIEEDRSLPQLIIIDGGKGQLSSAMHSLEQLGLNGEIAIIGIAKRLEEIYFPGDSTPLYLDKRSESLKLIQQLRDEAHRFGIKLHRKKRSKAMLKTVH